MHGGQRDFNDRDYVDDIEGASFSKETYQADAIRRGRFFQFTNRWTGVANGGTVSAYLENTSDDQPITLVSPSFQSSGPANIDVILNPDSYGTTNSSQVTIHNLNTSSAETSTVNGRYGSGVAVSGGNTVEKSLISGSGAGTSKIGGSSRADVMMYLEAGDSAIVRATNTSGTNSDFAAVVGFVQEKSGVPPEK